MYDEQEILGVMEKKKPLVSVCIPAYNNEEYIEETCRSVLAQTYENLELVVVDDCSGDGTVRIVESLADKRVRLVKNEKNLGMAGNWNRCIQEARGEFVKILCGDDILYPKSIEREAGALMACPKAVLAQSDTALIDREGKRVGAFRRFPKKGLMDGKKLCHISLLFNNFCGAPCNNTFRREAAIKAGGFDSAFTYILDFDFWMTLCGMGKVYIIHELLNGFRIRHDSNTGDVMGSGRKKDAYMEEHRMLVEKHRGAGVIKMGPCGAAFSLWFRRVRSRLIHLYLKIFTK